MALEKATITNTITGKSIPVMFNPEQYTMSKSNSFSEVGVPGTESPILQFTKGNTQTLNLELFFDTYEQRTDVRGYTNQIDNLLKIDPDTMAPPICIFTWGSLTFKGVIDSINKTFEMFLSNGVPVRAKITVNFKEYKSTDEQLLANPIQAIKSVVNKTVKAGETLASIAAKKFGDPRKWKELAKANNIENPRKLAAGLNIKVPSKQQVEKDAKSRLKKSANSNLKKLF